MVVPTYKIATPPTPDVQKVKVYFDDLYEATCRLSQAWNKAQVQEALQSIEFWCDKIEQTLKEK